MHKKLWAYAVAVAIVAVSSGLAVDYAWDNPDSFLGRCLFGAQTVAGFPMTPLHVTGKAAVMAYHGVRGLTDQGTTATWDHDPTCPPQMGPCEDSGAMEPALLPGAVVLEVEHDGLPVEAMPSVHDAVSRRGAAEACEDVQMPAVEDNTTVMPHVEDEDFLPETYVPLQDHADKVPCDRLIPKIECDGEKAKHPDIDTMEVRPSDLWFIDFMGPF